LVNKPRSTAGWEARRANVSMKIEKTLLHLCLEKNLDDITIDEIAERAGMSRRTFYRYFDNIESVLTASPGRSMRRMAQAVRSRPISENLRTAFVNATRELEISEEELETQRLRSQIVRKSPDSWRRAMVSATGAAQIVYRQLVEERLEARGKDIANAGVISGALAAVFLAILRPGDSPAKQAERLNEALRSLATAFES
jgi:AcrR family transcriptional regulator